MRVLFVGDIVGGPGREVVLARVPGLRQELSADYVVANAENAAAGMGITPNVCEALLGAADILTLGNHTFRHKEIEVYLSSSERVVRPANYHPAAPGRGWALTSREGQVPLAVLSLQGTVFMESMASPFTTFDSLIDELRSRTPAVIVDFHAEATAEKAALAYHADGRCSAVLGTHTHVQTADERILAGGTAFISDVGMTGPVDSIIGMDAGLVHRRFVLGLPTRFSVAAGAATLWGVLVDIDGATGSATAIQRIRID
ncbi:MAG TPA: TIGR00282 family metallophosphoesterase [Armatimonadota bacterium]|nr:TIGR00282 family metallophosphoesterase [Armatimonadota bacterium]